jgi:hypothetical protein
LRTRTYPHEGRKCPLSVSRGCICITVISTSAMELGPRCSASLACAAGVFGKVSPASVYPPPRSRVSTQPLPLRISR